VTWDVNSQLRTCQDAPSDPIARDDGLLRPTQRSRVQRGQEQPPPDPGPGKVMKLGRDLRCHNCRDVPGGSEGGGRGPGGTMEALTLTVVCHEGTSARSCHLPP
jgi:hypothetical protein